MAPKVPAVAQLEVARLACTLVLKQSKFKGDSCLVVTVTEISSERKVWLFDTSSLSLVLQRLADTLPDLAIREADLSDEFVAAILRGAMPRRSTASTACTPPCLLSPPSRSRIAYVWQESR